MTLTPCWTIPTSAPSRATMTWRTKLPRRCVELYSCVFSLGGRAVSAHPSPRLASKPLAAGAGLFVLTPEDVNSTDASQRPCSKIRVFLETNARCCRPYICRMAQPTTVRRSPSRVPRRLRQRAPTDPFTASRATTRPWREAAFVTRDRLRLRCRFRPTSAPTGIGGR